MKEEFLSNIIKQNYDLDIEEVEKIKNVYKLKTKDNTYCLKVINYEYPHFLFIVSAIKHLQRNGFDKIPEIIKTKENFDYIKLDNKYAYLTEWVLGRESNYDNPIELKKVAIKLGELHKCSEGFNVDSRMKPRIGWFSWIKVFETRRSEILDFKNRIEQKAYRDTFDDLYYSYINQEINRANKAIIGLKKSNYINYMEKEVFKRGFCHHDYANHNVIVDNNGNLNIIDFDYCILDSNIHDLSSLIIRTMKHGKWDINKANNIIKDYSTSNKVGDEAFSIMKEFIRFPQAFWQIGIQKYWEQQPWNEELFLSKFSKYVEDIKDRESFVESFY